MIQKFLLSVWDTVQGSPLQIIWFLKSILLMFLIQKAPNELIPVSSQLEKSGVRLFAGNQDVSLQRKRIWSDCIKSRSACLHSSYKSSLWKKHKGDRRSWTCISFYEREAGWQLRELTANPRLRLLLTIWWGLGWIRAKAEIYVIPLISLADDSSEDTVTVAELSSYQLETVDSFLKQMRALITNLTPDHLDRYPSSWGLFWF